MLGAGLSCQPAPGPLRLCPASTCWGRCGMCFCALGLPSSGLQGKDFRMSYKSFAISSLNGLSLPDSALSTVLWVCSFFPKNCASQSLLCEGILVVHDQRRLSYTRSPFMGANPEHTAVLLCTYWPCWQGGRYPRLPRKWWFLSLPVPTPPEPRYLS